MDRFNKFTDRARRVLTLAQQEAQRFDHKYIGTEHILLGLLRVGDGVATRVLQNIGADLPKIRTAVEFIIGRGDRPPTGEVGLTPRAKRVIELAIDEARRMDHHYIGTEHLLLGLVREGEGVAAGVLQSVGVNLDQLRHEVVRLIAEPSPSLPSGTLETARWVVDIAGSPLERVVGIGQVVVDADVSVELIALEVRGAGCVLYAKAHPEQERRLGLPRCAVYDDAGTDYRVELANWTGTEREVKGEFLVAPALPNEAMTMRIDLSGFDAWMIPPSMASEDVRGTWHFEFAIGG